MNNPRSLYLKSFVAGAIATIGFAISTLLFGVLVGAAAVGQGFSVVESMLMSATVFSASAQFAGLAIWQSPAPLIALAVSTLLISTRNILLGLSLAPSMPVHNPVLKCVCLFFITDPNTVLTLRVGNEFDRPSFLIGGGLILYMTWMLGTVCGSVFADLIDGSHRSSLGFAGPLVLLTMMVLLAKGANRQWRAWLISGFVAILLAYFSTPYFLVMPLSVACGVIMCLSDRRQAGEQ
ncbi:MAG: AzlC family ABC transporter permease [Pseudomonadota bacterium]